MVGGRSERVAVGRFRTVLARVTIEPGGTLSVSHTLPPMTLPAPTRVAPPRMVALA